MVKCPVCNSRKGKRPCHRFGSDVCSDCCGRSRSADACRGCGWYVPPRRDYVDIPRYSTQEMEDSDELDDIAFPIEAAVCALDRKREFRMLDAQAIAIFELLLDRYAFGDAPDVVTGKARELGCEDTVDLVERELVGQDPARIVRVLGVVWHVARRRDRGGRAHLDILQQYRGAFLRTGIAIRILQDGTQVAQGRVRDLREMEDPGFKRMMEDLDRRGIRFLFQTPVKP